MRPQRGTVLRKGPFLKKQDLSQVSFIKQLYRPNELDDPPQVLFRGPLTKRIIKHVKAFVADLTKRKRARI